MKGLNEINKLWVILFLSWVTIANIIKKQLHSKSMMKYSNAKGELWKNLATQKLWIGRQLMITRLYRIFLLDKRLMLRRCVIWTTSRHWRCYDIWDFVTDCLYYYPQNLWSWSPLWFIWYNCHLYHHIDDSLVSLQRLSSPSLLSLRLYDFLHYFYITTMVLVSWYSLFYNYIFFRTYFIHSHIHHSKK